jgi:hypothetical protein
MKKKRKDDKIFGNDYNTGNLEFEFYGKMKPATGDADTLNSAFTDNSFSSYERKLLRDELFIIFKAAPFYQKYIETKRTKKAEMFNIYYHFVKNIKGKYSVIQTFTEIANFMNMNYKDMYHLLLPNDKQDIIQELDDEFNILEKKSIKRLF